MQRQRAHPNVERVSSHNSFTPWDGSEKARETLESNLLVFLVQMLTYFGQERRYDAFLTQVLIRVLVEPEKDLRRQFNHDALEKSHRAWEIIVDKITSP